MNTTSNCQDPVEAEIEHALDPGWIMSDRSCFRFVNGVEQVATATGRLVTDDPARATILCETFLAGCYAYRPQRGVPVVRSVLPGARLDTHGR